MKTTNDCPSNIQWYLASIGNTPLLSQEEEIALAREYKETGSMEARNTLVEKNLRLVVSIAKRYAGSTYNEVTLDLIQAGNLGLMKAIDMFDPEAGFRLSTYATAWIKQSITRWIDCNGNDIRVPVHVLERVRKINKYTQEYTLEYGHKPSQEQIREKFKEFSDDFFTLLYSQDTLNIASLNTPVGEDEGGESELGDFIADSKSLEDSLEEEERQRIVKSVLTETLTEKEREVIIHRFGLDDKQPMTLAEVGEIYGVTRERIRQIEANALRRLKNSYKSRKALKSLLD